MKKQFINYQLVASLWACSVFTGFVATGATLYLRQQSFICASNLRKMEIQCSTLQNETLLLSAKVAQMQAPGCLRQQLLSSLATLKQVFHVQEWSSYKGTHMMRNALAMNFNKSSSNQYL